MGKDYAGERLLSLRGTVLLEQDSPRELRPTLALATETDLNLIDGEVQGEFPAMFRFDVTEPPPRTALSSDPSGELRGQFALGLLVMLPPDHPGGIPNLETSGFGECSEDGTQCTFDESACTPSGQCRNRKHEYLQTQCPLLGTIGGPCAALSLVSI